MSEHFEYKLKRHFAQMILLYTHASTFKIFLWIAFTF